MLESLEAWSLMKYVRSSVLIFSEPSKYLLHSILFFYSFPIFHSNFSYLWSSLSVAIHLFEKENCDLTMIFWFRFLFYLLLSGVFGLQVHWQMFLSLSLSLSLFFFFLLFRAAPAADGSSQVRGPIGAVAASLRHSHSNVGSEPCLWPTPQLTATPDP